MIYLYLDASVRRLFKQKYSPADLMHSHISNSDHSAGPPLEFGIYKVNLGISVCPAPFIVFGPPLDKIHSVGPAYVPESMFFNLNSSPIVSFLMLARSVISLLVDSISYRVKSSVKR